MTDAPREIMAIKLPGAKAATFLGGDTSPPFGPTEYIRKSALTLADCLDVPEVREMARLLKEVAPMLVDDLEASIRAEYGWPNVHPSQQRKYDMDMELVTEFRAALRKLGGGEG